MNNVYIVIGGLRGCNDDAILGLYPTVKMAEKRIEAVKDEYDFIGYELVKVGADGGDFNIGTR